MAHLQILFQDLRYQELMDKAFLIKTLSIAVTSNMLFIRRPVSLENKDIGLLFCNKL